MKASKKDIYSSGGNKVSATLKSVFELALESEGSERTAQMLEKIAQELRAAPRPAGGTTTPYVNTIPASQEPEYPGNL